MNVGESHIFSYTGTIQAYTIPNTGLYQLDLVGATCGINTYIQGKAGGSTTQYVYLEKGTIIYVVVGGAGTAKITEITAVGQRIAVDGGYNGGGSGTRSITSSVSYYVGQYSYMSSGGGATHIALQSGLLSTIKKANVLAVAGGSGGCDIIKSSATELTICGGAGGGLSGDGSVPGTQTGGYAFGRGHDCGGGGLYGGNSYSGGSGYLSLPNCYYRKHSIGATYRPRTNVGTTTYPNARNGSAKITLLRETTSIPKMWLGTYAILDIKLGDKSVNFKQRKVIFDSTEKQYVYDTTIDTLESKKYTRGSYFITDNKVGLSIPAILNTYSAIYFSKTVDFSLYSKLEITYHIAYKGANVRNTLTLDVSGVNVNRYLTFVLFQESLSTGRPGFNVCICDSPEQLYNGAYLTAPLDLYDFLPIKANPDVFNNMYKVTIDKVVAY